MIGVFDALTLMIILPFSLSLQQGIMMLLIRIIFLLVGKELL